MKKLLFTTLFFMSLGVFAQDDVEVSGNTITVKEIAPVWPGCEDNDNQKACFNSMLIQHVKKTYKYPKNEKGEFIRGKAIVSLVINEEGKVEVTEVKGENAKINAEAKRMVESIPTLTPGKQAGKPVKIKYTMPFNF
ncbi:energy transducer TonB [Gramella sp. AN32]|uniref:Energy transducer TonB n=1 Tax=Christiangramia antarctica TaxID=2058158 RepID=A0ABW5X6C4_9FLAO|nr:energy transducer TonB [Gramella sp. AN32]MCM4157740.1 energy transducer TonB [Gramella sp. AN32]